MIKELICRYVTLWNKTPKIQVVAFIMKYFNSLSWLPANVGSAIWSLFTGTFHDGNLPICLPHGPRPAERKGAKIVSWITTLPSLNYATIRIMSTVT